MKKVEIMQKNNLLYERKSIRNFSDKKIPTEILENIIRDACQSPSWQNTQPWQVYLASGETLDKIKKQFRVALDKGQKTNPDLTVPHRVNRTAFTLDNIAKWNESVKEAVGKKGVLDEVFEDAKNNLFHAPYIAYLTVNKKASEFTIFDLGAFGQTLMLAAAGYGISSIPAYALVKYADIVKDNLQVPEDQKLVIGIALGYSSDNKINKVTTKRAPLDKILHIKD